MKNQAAPIDTTVVRAPPAHVREGAIRDLYLPREAKARINRFAHQEAEHHGQAVKSRVLASLGALANQGKQLPELLVALTAMTAEPEGRLADGSDEVRTT